MYRPVPQEPKEATMNDLNLLVAHAEITRRVADAEQRTRVRSCRTARPLLAALRNRSARL
jgi:hypothetical protein